MSRPTNTQFFPAMTSMECQPRSVPALSSPASGALKKNARFFPFSFSAKHTRQDMIRSKLFSSSSTQSSFGCAVLWPPVVQFAGASLSGISDSSQHYSTGGKNICPPFSAYFLIGSLKISKPTATTTIAVNNLLYCDVIRRSVLGYEIRPKFCKGTVCNR